MTETIQIPREQIAKMMAQLTDEGRLIEAGWMSMKCMALPPDASEMQIHEMRKAFFAGAQHLFASILSILDTGSEATGKDIERMANIHQELENFCDELKNEMN